MLDAARNHLRETIAAGDSGDVLDAEVEAALPRSSEEERASLWLYAWHRSERGDDGARPPVLLG
jgi:hypothetical protein